MNTSIIDVPRQSDEPDTFGIAPYQKGLIEFTSNSATPITIALQGEWGSGKTSLMNTLAKDLCGEGAPYHNIWLNTWEYALMKDAETALIGILSGLIEKIMSILKQDESETKKMLFKLGQVVGRIATNVAVTQANKVVGSAGDTVAESFSSNTEATIGSLRDDLESVIANCVDKDNKKKGIVFFIDDLDRIDPPVAVQLLELLKNIFSLKNCIFILAIDYDVVIKGLEPKFGKFCEANEREFRSFFDKIIQLPFSMPVSSYNIDKFLTNNLTTIGYLNDLQSRNKELASFITRAANFTVGNNPRALKRLLNSLSLISCINRAKGSDQDANEDADPDLDLQVNFALVSLQVAYPTIYRMVDQKPDFDQWNEHTALEFNLKSLTEDQILKISTNEEFDEPWEHVLFQACEADLYLRKKALSVSMHLNGLKALIESKQENVGEVVGNIISLSSVTSMEAFDKPVIDYHRGSFLKDARRHIIEKLKKLLPEIGDQIQTQGKRVQTNAWFKYTDKDWAHSVRLFSRPHDGGIRLSIETDYRIMPANTEEAAELILQQNGVKDLFIQIRDDYANLFKPDDNIQRAQAETNFGFIYDEHFCVDMGLTIDLSSTADFLDNESNKMEASHMLSKMYHLRIRLEKLKEKIEYI